MTTKQRDGWRQQEGYRNARCCRHCTHRVGSRGGIHQCDRHGMDSLVNRTGVCNFFKQKENGQ